PPDGRLEKRTLRAYLSADHSRRYRRTGRALQLQWLHDERELKGPCLGEVLEDVDHATEVRVHRAGDDVLTFPICEQRPARSASSSRDNPTSSRAACRPVISIIVMSRLFARR